MVSHTLLCSKGLSAHSAGSALSVVTLTMTSHVAPADKPVQGLYGTCGLRQGTMHSSCTGQNSKCCTPARPACLRGALLCGIWQEQRVQQLQEAVPYGAPPRQVQETQQVGHAVKRPNHTCTYSTAQAITHPPAPLVFFAPGTRQASQCMQSACATGPWVQTKADSQDTSRPQTLRAPHLHAQCTVRPWP